MGRIRVALIGVGAFVAITLLFAAPFAVGAYLDGRRGERAALEAIELANSGDLRGATARLTDARRDFDGAASKLASPLAAPAKLVPLIGRQLRAAQGLASAGGLSARAGIEAARALDAKPAAGWIRDGRVDIDAVRRAAAAVRAAAPPAHEAKETVDGVPGSFLFPPLARARTAAAERITSAASSIDKANAGLSALPALLGADGPRRHLLLFSNLAELRGTGGFYGFHAMLTADGGNVAVGEPGRPRDDLPPLRPAAESVAPDWFRRTWEIRGSLDVWQDVNLSPDFPTVGRIVAQATGTNGVIQLDAVGIASLLRLTGPVSLETWPVPITADNVARVASHDVYVRYTDEPRRDAFGEELLVAVFRRVLSGGIDIGAAALTELGRATAGGHLQAYANDPSIQPAMVKLGMHGGLDRARDATDVVGVYTDNADASKQDYFLRREVEYTVDLKPDTNSATGELEVLLRDEMPVRGEPDYVMGRGQNAPPLDNRQGLEFVRPARSEVSQVSLDGSPLSFSPDEEAGLQSQYARLVVPNGRSTRVRAVYEVPNALEGAGNVRTYRLRLLHQPTLQAGRYWVRINAPTGWRVDRRVFDGMQMKDEIIEVRLKRSAWSWVGAQVQRPFKAIASLF